MLNGWIFYVDRQASQRITCSLFVRGISVCQMDQSFSIQNPWFMLSGNYFCGRKEMVPKIKTVLLMDTFRLNYLLICSKNRFSYSQIFLIVPKNWGVKPIDRLYEQLKYLSLLILGKKLLTVTPKSSKSAVWKIFSHFLREEILSLLVMEIGQM